jgi:hypothetical protein
VEHSAGIVVASPRFVYYDEKGGQSMPETTLEQRLTAVEDAIRELQQALRGRQPAVDWLDRVIGSMKDEPAFDEVLAYGRAIRQADRPIEDDAP